MHNRLTTDSVAEKGKPIWTRLFNARVQYIDTLSDEYIKTVGVPSVGEEIYDRDMKYNLVNIMITIDGMVEHFKKGNTIRISNHSDTKVIYDIIVDYLNAWNNRLSNAINVNSAPVEDLRVLDTFAEKIYPHAKNHIKFYDPTLKIINSFGVNHMDSMGMLTGTSVKEEIDKVPEKHDNLGDLFAQAVASRGGSLWK